MHIIPVIDLRNGVVVHAKKGARQQYQPIASKLTPFSAPIKVVEALLAVYPFSQLYIADLNAIEKNDAQHPNNDAHILEIQQAFPQLHLWLDAGISQPNDLMVWQKIEARIVLGSENLKDIAAYNALKSKLEAPILSLDFMPTGYQGPSELLQQTKGWPQEVIVMSLADVGASSGPNINLINEVKKLSAKTHIIAAGGIRDKTDLIKLKQMGVRSALIATALHEKKLSYTDIAELAT